MSSDDEYHRATDIGIDDANIEPEEDGDRTPSMYSSPDNVQRKIMRSEHHSRQVQEIRTSLQ